MESSDICIAGAGIIGLSLALELHRRGACVIVLDSGAPLAQASTAAAGMLAANDPENPSELQSLANLSESLYPAWLDRIEALSGIRVALHTSTTLQALSPHVPSSTKVLSRQALTHLLPQLNPASQRFISLTEHSLDPLELAAALLAAVRTTSINLRPFTPVSHITSGRDGIKVHTSAGSLHTGNFIDCTGAWSTEWAPRPELRVTPRKGQMLSLALPADLPLKLVVRTPQVYVVPRTHGPLAGRAIVGATVEDAGFDNTVHHTDIAHLQALAAELLPPLAGAPVLDSWAGLRPATPDHLPLLGFLAEAPGRLIATGHYRNGILLAPVTALVMAQLLSGEVPAVDLAPFSPARALPIPQIVR